MPHATSHGTRIYYEVHGEAQQTLILAHGMGGNGAIWFNQIAHFAPNYRVVTFDHRYFARSGCPVDHFNPAWFPDDVMAIMDAEEIDAATFVCQSMGGWTGSQMAVNHADRVEALIMSHTPGIFTHVSAVNDRRAVAELIGRRQGPFSNAALAEDYPGKNPAGAVLYNQVSSFNNIDPAVIPRAIAEANIAVDTETLADYNVPTLFITADKDVLFPPGYIEALATTVPGAEFANLGDAGHSSYFEIPDAFNARVATFLSSV